MKTEHYPEGKLIFAEGDEGEEAYRILNGSVEVFIHDGSKKVVLATLGSEEIFGEMGMIEQRPRSASVRALEDLEVEVITRDDFNKSLKGGGEKLIPYLLGIFERLRVTNERLRWAMKELEKGNSKKKVPVAGEVKVVHDGPTLEILPDSEETSSQSALEARMLRHFPFMIGRRGEVAGVGLFAENRMLIADRMPYRISRKHCQIEMDSDVFFVRDHNSKLGTYVNGVGLGGPNKEIRARLSPGDNKLVLGGPDSEIRFILRV